jgi:hypothetical protein
MRAGPVLAVVIVCVLTASVQPASAGSEKGWCAAVIKLNTKYGTMKKKRYLRPSEVTPRAWRHVVDAWLAGRDRYIALAPRSIKTAVKHELAWYAKVKASHYSRQTPFPPLTSVDITKLTNFESTRCGITFAGDWPLPPS